VGPTTSDQEPRWAVVDFAVPERKGGLAKEITGEGGIKNLSREASDGGRNGDGAGQRIARSLQTAWVSASGGRSKTKKQERGEESSREEASHETNSL